MSNGLKEVNRLYKTMPFVFEESKTKMRCLENIAKELSALDVIRQNFKLVGNCLQAKNKYAKDGWVFVKELEEAEEHNAWKEILL